MGAALPGIKGADDLVDRLVPLGKNQAATSRVWWAVFGVGSVVAMAMAAQSWAGVRRWLGADDARSREGRSPGHNGPASPGGAWSPSWQDCGYAEDLGDEGCRGRHDRAGAGRAGSDDLFFSLLQAYSDVR
eukprot:TRINITY_DN29484_c0_g1_i1.p2 TRINITY_DN29484_c0_g1~~TRINITY_DN29484_c0_g1_i1.p2  ORF type:complete len:131 (-),score=16.83 TRINITY_DN29484_c0_g1_i1:118-510(-)